MSVSEKCPYLSWPECILDLNNYRDPRLEAGSIVCFLVKCVICIVRGSAELLEESGGNISPADSMTSIPTCMPFSWFGDKDRDKEREPSSSSSSLPYTATETSSEQSQDRRTKVWMFLWILPKKKYHFWMVGGTNSDIIYKDCRGWRNSPVCQEWNI